MDSHTIQLQHFIKIQVVWEGDISIIIYIGARIFSGQCMRHSDDIPRTVVPLLITDKPITILSDCRYLQVDCVKRGLCQFPNVIWYESAWGTFAWACRCFFTTFSCIASMFLTILISPLSDRRKMRLMPESHGYVLRPSHAISTLAFSSFERNVSII